MSERKKPTCCAFHANGGHGGIRCGKRVKKLSPTQLDVVIRMRVTGRRLTRFSGGFWVLEGYPPGVDRFGAPMRDGDEETRGKAWYCATNTVGAMTRHGWLEAQDPERYHHWERPRALTDRAKAVELENEHRRCSCCGDEADPERMHSISPEAEEPAWKPLHRRACGRCAERFL